MRSFKTAFSETFLTEFQKGVLDYTYKGFRCMKCPLDMAIYTKLIWDLQPKSFVEIGTDKGGSALWFADILSTFRLPARVISIDNRASSEVKDGRIDFLLGDVHDLSPVLTDAAMAALPRPLLVIEDSAHTYASTLAAIRFFDRVLLPGDVLVIEDGVLDQLGLSEQHQGGPNRAIAEFMSIHPGRFELMPEYCDIYGVNATYNPNGYLKKLA